MLEQERTRVVRPLQIVEPHHEAVLTGHTFEELADALEQVASLLVGWKLDRRRDIAELPAYVWHQAGHLRRSVAQRRAQRLGWHDPHALFDQIDKGDKRRRALDLVAPARQREAAPFARQVEHLFNQTGLANAGLASKQDDAAPAQDSLVEMLAEIGEFTIPTHVRGPSHACR